MLTKNRDVPIEKNGQVAAGFCSLRKPAAACPTCYANVHTFGLIHKIFRGGRKRRGQQILEYAIMLGAISTAFIAMFIYSRRGLQAVIKAQSDQLGSQRDSEKQVFLETSQSYSRSATVAGDQASRDYNNGAVALNVTSTSASSGTAVTVSTELAR